MPPATTRPALGRDLFTTGQVAKLAGVASRTAVLWVDRGLLKGYRVPGGRDRRVSRAELARFFCEHNMPDALARLQESAAVLYWGLQGSLAAELYTLLAPMPLHHFIYGFDAGMFWAKHRPPSVVLDANAGRAEALAIAHALFAQPAAPRVVILWPESETVPEGQSDLVRSVAFLRHPTTAAAVAAELAKGD